MLLFFVFLFYFLGDAMSLYLLLVYMSLDFGWLATIVTTNDSTVWHRSLGGLRQLVVFNTGLYIYIHIVVPTAWSLCDSSRPLKCWKAGHVYTVQSRWATRSVDAMYPGLSGFIWHPLQREMWSYGWHACCEGQRALTWSREAQVQITVFAGALAVSHL